MRRSSEESRHFLDHGRGDALWVSRTQLPSTPSHLRQRVFPETVAAFARSQQQPQGEDGPPPPRFDLDALLEVAEQCEDTGDYTRAARLYAKVYHAQVRCPLALTSWALACGACVPCLLSALRRLWGAPHPGLPARSARVRCLFRPCLWVLSPGVGLGPA